MVADQATIIIHNIPSTQTLEDHNLAISGPSASVFTRSSIRWDPCSSSAQLQTAGGLSSLVTYEFSFTVINQKNALELPPWCPLGLGNCMQISIIEEGGQNMVGVDALGGAAVLQSAAPVEFTRSEISHSSASRNSSNIISVRLRLSGDLPPGSSVTIDGLTGSQTESGSVPVFGPQAHLVLNQTIWSQDTGRATLTVAQVWNRNKDVHLSFTLLNPDQHLNAEVTSISASSRYFMVRPAVLVGVATYVDLTPPSFTFGPEQSQLRPNGVNISAAFDSPVQAVCIPPKPPQPH